MIKSMSRIKTVDLQFLKVASFGASKERPHYNPPLNNIGNAQVCRHSVLFSEHSSVQTALLAISY